MALRLVHRLGLGLFPCSPGWQLDLRFREVVDTFMSITRPDRGGQGSSRPTLGEYTARFWGS